MTIVTQSFAKTAGILLSLLAQAAVAEREFLMPENAHSEITSQAAGEPLARLEAAVLELEDIEAVKRLQRAYGYYLDGGQWNAAADVFTADAVLEVPHLGQYHGRERIRLFLQSAGGGRPGLREGQLYEHLQLQPVVHVAADGRSARARWRQWIMSGEYHKRALWAEGPIEAVYEKTGGVWAISDLRVFETFCVDYDGGWAAHAAGDACTSSAAIPPPDAPPTSAVEPWPAVSVPPFHYPNPGCAKPVQPLPAVTVPEATGSSEVRRARAVSALSRRVQVLRDQAEIGNLISAYGYYRDKRLWDELALLLADDVEAEFGQRGLYRGRARVRAMLELFGPPGLEYGQLDNHLQVQPVIHVAPDGTRAWARSREISQTGTYGGNGYWGDGVYENRFVKTGGVWKFQVLRFYPTFLSRYDRGYVDGAVPLDGPSRVLPPDAPPTDHFGAFPAAHLPPFHYPHPVSGRAIRGAQPVASGPTLPDPETTGVGKLPELADLDRRITRLEDVDAVVKLQRTYGFFVDKALWSEVSDLFADDGTLEIGGRGVFVSRQRVYQYMRFLGPEGPRDGRLINHLVLQPLVTVAADGRSAQARARSIAQGGDGRHAADDAPGVPTDTYLGTSYYENGYVKQEGVWKIRRLHGIFRMYTLERDGWHKTALPMTGVERDLPPDRPPSAAYEIYPEPFVPPYHYEHPVTGKK